MHQEQQPGTATQPSGWHHPEDGSLIPSRGGWRWWGQEGHLVFPPQVPACTLPVASGFRVPDTQKGSGGTTGRAGWSAARKGAWTFRGWSPWEMAAAPPALGWT